MNVTVKNLPSSTETAEIMAQFDSPLDADTRSYLNRRGFSDARTKAVGCMHWAWCQWLQGGPKKEIRSRIESFVDRGMEMQEVSSQFYMRSRHDLYLLHCAIFGSPHTQIRKLAERVVDTSGYKGQKPQEKDGVLYESAWCGMLKYWILGDRRKAAQQAEVIWAAYRDPSCRGATKPLVSPWLKGDWEAFAKAQQKDFDTLWKRAGKDRIAKFTKNAVVVDVGSFSIEQLWCWAHCGIALLAHREGVEVATDPFWFPAHALKVIRPED